MRVSINLDMRTDNDNTKREPLRDITGQGRGKSHTVTCFASRLNVLPMTCLLGVTTITSTVRISGNFSYAVRSWPLFVECACKA